MDKQGNEKKPAARERAEALLDGASFVELGRHFEQSVFTPGYECAAAPGEGVVTGYGTLDGRPVYLFAQDAFSLSGSMSRGQAEKITRVMDMALHNGSPVIGILDSLGARVAEGAAAMGAFGSIIKKFGELSGVVPTILVAAGGCIGAGAVLAAAADFTIAVKGCALALHSPQVLLAAGLDPAQAGAAAVFARGGAQFLAEGDADAFALVRRILSFLPQNNLEDAPDGDAGDLNRRIPGPLAGETIDIKALISAIADDGGTLEINAGWGKSMFTGLVSLGGTTVGVVANVDGAAPDAAGCRKAARLVSLLDAYHLPVLTLADCGDIPPGDESLAGALAALALAYSSATSPMVTVVTGKAVGTGLLAMCPKSAGADIVYAWEGAVLSAMPIEAGALLMYDDVIKNAGGAAAARQEAILKYQAGFADAASAARQGLVDDCIEPSSTRQMVIAAFEACASKRLAARPPKKHGVWPL